MRASSASQVLRSGLAARRRQQALGGELQVAGLEEGQCPAQNSSRNRMRNRRPLIVLLESRENACLAIRRSSAT